ncbi:MAG: MobV family relaxase [Methylobacter sp.]
MYGIIRIQKHNSIASVRGSGKHKDREQETFNADPLRTPLNVTEGAQSSDALLSAIQARVELATVQVAGNYKPVIAVEYLITASPEFFRTQPPEAVDAYFDRAKAWLRQKHGADNVVSITRHNDETSPHLSAFVVPLVIRAAGTRKRSVIAGKDENGRPIRELREFARPAEISLSARHYFGGSKKTLSELQTEFHSEVSSCFGLERGQERSGAHHKTIRQWYSELSPTNDTVRRAAAHKDIVAAIAALPEDKRDRVKALMQEGLYVVSERDRKAREAVTRTARARNDDFRQRNAAPVAQPMVRSPDADSWLRQKINKMIKREVQRRQEQAERLKALMEKPNAESCYAQHNEAVEAGGEFGER